MQTISFKDLLAKLGSKRIDRIYVGREMGCRCGCLGKYHEPGTRGFKMALTRISKANPTVRIFIQNEYGPWTEKDSDYAKWLEFTRSREYQWTVGVCFANMTKNYVGWVDFVCGEDRTITVYFE